MAKISEYFCLKKETFNIDPRDDAEIYFGDSELEKRLSDRIQSDFVSRRAVPKFFVHGQYGAGKTHTLRHIAHSHSSPRTPPLRHPGLDPGSRAARKYP